MYNIILFIEIQHLSFKQKSQPNFKEDPIAYLLYKCNIKSKKKCLEIELSKTLDKIKYRGSYILNYKGIPINNSISETIRIIDTK